MNVVLLRVGLDTGCGGCHSPLFPDGSFEFVPIPDDRGIDERNHGNTTGRHGRLLRDYFATDRQVAIAAQSMHVDPEFESFTRQREGRRMRALTHRTIAKSSPSIPASAAADHASVACASPSATFSAGSQRE